MASDLDISFNDIDFLPSGQNVGVLDDDRVADQHTFLYGDEDIEFDFNSDDEIELDFLSFENHSDSTPSYTTSPQHGRPLGEGLEGLVQFDIKATLSDEEKKSLVSLAEKELCKGAVSLSSDTGEFVIESQRLMMVLAFFGYDKFPVILNVEYNGEHGGKKKIATRMIESPLSFEYFELPAPNKVFTSIGEALIVGKCMRKVFLNSRPGLITAILEFVEKTGIRPGEFKSRDVLRHGHILPYFEVILNYCSPQAGDSTRSRWNRRVRTCMPLECSYESNRGKADIIVVQTFNERKYSVRPVSFYALHPAWYECAFEMRQSN